MIVIDDDDDLYKRLAPELCYPDGKATSGVYKLKGTPDPEPSVDLARMTTPDAVLARAPKPGFGLGILKVKDVKEIGFTVEHRPVIGNPAHCVLVGENTKQTTRLLAERTRTLIPAAGITQA